MNAPAEPDAADTKRLVVIDIDDASIGRASPDVEHERAVAIYDLIEKNHFCPVGHDGGPYALSLSIAEERLVFSVEEMPARSPVVVHLLSLTPFRKIIKDYYLICESYYAAIKTAAPRQIEAIDMGRRGLHNEGSEILMARLSGKIDIDFDTARRLFTLVCVLHWKG